MRAGRPKTLTPGLTRLTTLAEGVIGRVREFGESLGAAVARAFSRNTDTKRFFVLNSDEMRALADALHASMPQASLVDGGVTCAPRDWRTHFTGRLAGSGIEIGALYKPMVCHAGMTVRYADCLPAASLRAMYPELAGERLVEPDIVDDAQVLGTVESASCDFVIAAHVLEHLPNPIQAIENWLRILRPAGLLYLVVPDKRVSFDRARVRTSIEHLLLDYRRPSADRDFEHFLEYASLVHNARGEAALREADRLKQTAHSIHFHVLMPSDVVAMLQWMAVHVQPLAIVEGPCMNPHDDEFHVLIRKES
jgi:SAM-dependent methyltransferase